jgi:spore coat polysaccharide biosynthesis predicted glycosyltransferase SpsG
MKSYEVKGALFRKQSELYKGYFSRAQMEAELKKWLYNVPIEKHKPWEIKNLYESKADELWADKYLTETERNKKLKEYMDAVEKDEDEYQDRFRAEFWKAVRR